ncbi:MAG TPA: aromatic ring-hydroxylating dioxygenase subunit alpha [Candidatus Eisenbacteria bacterium]|nr:aromatic ring-hydroxylating dioxygenase subunit alpha [Candidatus Eisenbacteria bacterium]
MFDPKRLIIDNPEGGVFRVHRSAMTSVEVLQIEQERIFNKCWLYLGHESEVESAGDYRRRNVAGRPLFFVRGNDGKVRVFLNTCTHRGALICRNDQGRADVLQCFYHAWTFNNHGDLIGVPDEAGYGDRFNRAEFGLKPPPRVDSYRGFVFVSFNPDVEDLVTYLAGAREYLDLVVDQAEQGMRIVPGSNRYFIKANWKLLVENSLDGYHVRPTHKTYFEYVNRMGINTSGVQVAFSRPSRVLGNGHAVEEHDGIRGRPIARWSPLFGEETKEEIAAIRARLVRKFGEQKARHMADVSRNLLVYPNLLIIDSIDITVRVFWPIAPDLMEVTAWQLAPKEEKPALLARRLDNFLTFHGPGGFATPDDVEAIESCQAGYKAEGVEWSELSRGMHREAIAEDELQLRAFWRQWFGHMSGLAQVETDDPAIGKKLASAR